MCEAQTDLALHGDEVSLLSDRSLWALLFIPAAVALRAAARCECACRGICSALHDLKEALASFSAGLASPRASLAALKADQYTWTRAI